jgi:hypothetical protein
MESYRKYDFLKKGGILLRQNISDKGEYVVEKLSYDKDWNPILICESPKNCRRIMNILVDNHPSLFQSFETQCIDK